MRKLVLAVLTLLSVAACTPQQARLVAQTLRGEATTFLPAQVYGGCASGVVWGFGRRDANGFFFDGVVGTITITVDGVVVRSYQPDPLPDGTFIDPTVLADGTFADKVTRAKEMTHSGQWVTNDDPHTWSVTVTQNGVVAFTKSGSYACVPFSATTPPLEINHPADASTGAVGG